MKEIKCDIAKLQQILGTLEEDAKITVVGEAKNGDLEKIRPNWLQIQLEKTKKAKEKTGSPKRIPKTPRLSLDISSLENVTKIEANNWAHINGDNASFTPPDDIFHFAKLVSVVLPKNLKEIGKRAFFSCMELESVVFPEDVKIEKDAFLGCDKLDLYGIVRQNALFIHGFGGSGESSTGKCVEKALCENYDFIKPDFDLTDVNGTLSEIQKIIKSKDIKLVAGTSLGAFYTLACGFDERNIRRIAVNPCMKPSEEIPKLKDFKTGNPVEVPEETLLLWKKMEEETYKEKEAKNVTGLFADKDELFGNKYHEFFAKCYGAENIHTFEGGHHGGSEKLTQALGEVFQGLP